ncbi:hypothetical protein B0H13DRAFT_1906850 [Mycena leptocephala]|nr:hypothetical protein B0H13DRAFT_1906850 [Mycena leptocephala]
MPPKQSLCRDCPILGHTHSVKNTVKIAHDQEIMPFREQELQSNLPPPPVPAPPSAGSAGLAGLMSVLSLTDNNPQPPSRVSVSVSPSDETNSTLADYLTALVLTDDGPNSHQQPSKLFSSLDEVQEMSAADIPDNFRPIPVSEASRSVNALLTHQMPSPLKKFRGGDILLAIKKDVGDAFRTLDVLFDKDNLEDVACMRGILDNAAEVVITAGTSLKGLPATSAQKELRAQVIMDVQVLDRHINVISARLPRVPVTGPASYNAHLDLIAQMTVLLAIICNVILHLGNDPCNFILEMVKAIVHLALASNGSNHETQ